MKQKNFLSFLFIISILLSTNCQVMSGIMATETPTITATTTATPTLTPRPTPTRRPSLTPTPEAGRYTSPDGSYSFFMPEDWDLEDEGDEYTLIRGPAHAGFQPTLIIAKISDSMMLELWTASVQDETISIMQGYSLISEDFIETDDGETFLRWEFTATQNGSKFHFVFYMYDPGSWKLVMTYMRLEKAGGEDDAMIDASARSVLYR
jgi:hypothetical protein